jgi:mannose-1-phosphate guanylyltransferase
VLLARGYGRQVDSHQRVFRDPLLPVALTPLIHYPLRWLARCGTVQRVAICARDAATSVLDWSASADAPVFDVAMTDESYPRGPAGVAKDAAALVPSARYVVCEGSRLPDLDLTELLAAHQASGAAITTVVETDRRSRHGPGKQLPGGVYVFEQAALDLVPDSGFQDIKQGLLELAHRQQLGVHAFQRRGITPAIVDFASYIGTSNWLVCNLDQRRDEYPGFVPCGEGLRHPSSIVASDATLMGPVLIGARARIDSHAVIVGPSVIGEDAVVGPHATVSRSVLLTGAMVAESAHVDWCVVTHGAEVRANRSVEDRVVAPRGGLRERPTPATAQPPVVLAQNAAGG